MDLQGKNNGLNNPGDVLRKAADKLATLDPKFVCLKSGVIYNREQDSYLLPYLNRKYLVHHSSGKIEALFPECKDNINLWILFLHYLACADGTPLSGEWVAFKDLPGGRAYTEPEQKGNTHPIFRKFGINSPLLQEKAARLGAKPADMGSYSLLFRPFPRVPVIFVSWHNDREFSLADNVLFDTSATHYLPIEDCAILPELIMQELWHEVNGEDCK